ncbi:hypothetical protein GCM10019017_76650 [Streptomyces showdoensis]
MPNSPAPLAAAAEHPGGSVAEIDPAHGPTLHRYRPGRLTGTAHPNRPTRSAARQARTIATRIGGPPMPHLMA